MIAGICAAAVISAILPGSLNVSTTLGTGVSAAQGVFLEMFLTSLLVITIFMLAAEKHKATFLAPIGIGLSLFVAEMVGVFFTGGSLNPTRSFGPCVVTRNFPSYHYIYWFGPAMGTLLAFGVYKIVKSVEYETVNPGQDFDDHEVHLLPLPPRTYTNPSTQAAAFNPPEDPYSAEQVERPNVAAIAAQDAVRRMGSDLSDEKENETSSSSNGNDHSGIDERVWHDKNEAQRSADDDDANHHIERRRSSRDTRTTRDQMAVEAETLSRSGRGSMRRGPSGGDAWV
jgi:aquaporin related protein